jgi:23S rRNA pseudouridine1911/1915/1917 synthase
VAEIEWQGSVGSEDAGLRLDQFLADHLGSRARAARLITAGLVEVDGRSVQKRHAVSSGERVVVNHETFSPPPEADPARAASAAELNILFEDEALIVVDKPAGVVVHPARGHESGTLAQTLADRAAGGEDPYRAGIVHRLDRETSGLLVVAKSDAVHRRLKELLQARELRRQYLTLVDGIACCTRSTPTHRVRHARTSSCSRRCDTRRCCASRSRQGVRTRYACTCRRSDTRSWETTPTADHHALAWSGSSCTPNG